ncbi:hypothetical protein, partial [Mycetocola reblochoni]
MGDVSGVGSSEATGIGVLDEVGSMDDTAARAAGASLGDGEVLMMTPPTTAATRATPVVTAVATPAVPPRA